MLREVKTEVREEPGSSPTISVKALKAPLGNHYIHAIDFYSATNRNELLILAYTGKQHGSYSKINRATI